MVALAGAQGDVIYLDATQDYSKGDFYVKSRFAGICIDDAKSGGVVAVQTKGLFKGVTKNLATDNITRGERLFAKDGDNKVSDQSSFGTPCGYAADVSGNGTAKVDLILVLGA